MENLCGRSGKSAGTVGIEAPFVIIVEKCRLKGLDSR